MMDLKKTLPEIYKDFEENRKNGFLEVKNNKEKGIPLIGYYCTYYPTEIAESMGIQSVSLCSFSNETMDIAEKYLPKNICPLIKSSFGFAKSDKCPYFYFADLIVGETTCDGKKKMYEDMALFKDVHVMELPNRQSTGGMKLWKEELILLKEVLEKKFQRKFSEERLKECIAEKNNERKAMKKFAELMALDPPPMSSRELYNVLYGSSYEMNKMNFSEKIYSLINKIKENYDSSKLIRKPRILVTGCPIGGATEKILDAIESSGGTAVAFENCGGAKPIEDLTDEENPDMFEALAERYLNIGCSCMSPNKNRIHLLEKMCDLYHVDGILEMVLHACHTYSLESNRIKEFCRGKKIGYLNVETDYSPADIGQLNTRVAAFIEML